MTVVILGAGRVGQQLAKELIEENKEVILIEKDPKHAQNVSRQLDCMIINDSGNSLEVLHQAGTEKADFFVALTESDEINMIACALVASSFKKPVTIARVRNLDYSKTWNLKNSFLGISHIVNPEIEVALAITRTVEHGAVSSIVQFETSNLQMRNFHVKPGFPIAGKQIHELKAFFPVEFMIAVIVRDDEAIIPAGNTQIKENDHLWILAGTESFESIFKALNIKEPHLKDIVIAGGGRIGISVVQFLQNNITQADGRAQSNIRKIFRKQKHRIHIVEKNYEKCKELAELFPEASVTNADISEDGIFEEGIFDNMDLLITTTGNQELNIITAAHARKAGIRKSLALVQKGSNASIATELGVDVAISITETLVSSIQKILRKGFARSIYNFNNSDLEMIELDVNSKPGMINQAVKNIKLPHHTLILMVTRKGLHIIPRGDFILEPDDFLLIITDKDGIQELS